MKIKNTISKKKILLPVLAILLVSGSGLFAMYHYQVGLFKPHKVSDEQKIDLKKPTQDQVTAGVTAKNNFDSRSTEASQERQTASGDKSTSNEGQVVQTIISSSNINGSTLSVRSIIQTIDSSGTCTLVLSKPGSQGISNTASTQTMGSYTTCAGFDIDTSGLARGDWSIKLTYSGSAGQSGTATKTVTLQ